MAQVGDDADDLAVSLTWAGEAAVVPEAAAVPPPAPSPGRQPRPVPPRPPGTQRTFSSGAQHTASPVRPDPQARSTNARPSPSPSPPPSRVAPPRRSPEPASPEAELRTPGADPAQARLPRAGPAPHRSRPVDEPPANETLLNILEHLSTLSRLVTGTSRASTAQLEALGVRVEKAVDDLDALQMRVLRSLAGFDALRLRVQKELSDRPPLSDEEVSRIAEAVTARLLDHVRVETEGNR